MADITPSTTDNNVERVHQPAMIKDGKGKSAPAVTRVPSPKATTVKTPSLGTRKK